MSHTGGEYAKFTVAGTVGNSGTASLNLTLGGEYRYVINAGTWNAGTITLNILGADGTTEIPIFAGVSANVTGTVDLPPGQIQVVSSGATVASGVNVGLISIPK